MLKPRRLMSGARIAVVAPASPFQRHEFDDGIAEIARLGFEPVWDESVFARHGYVAGTAEVRAGAMRRALQDPDIGAVVAVRGGYGSAQLLPLLDVAEVRRACKPVIGYSDITALLTYITRTCGMVAFHGPMLQARLAKGAEGYDAVSFRRALSEPTPMGEIEADGVDTIAAGEWSGPLFGGTVTQLLASLATPWAFDPPPGHVLFFDEVAERPYRLDRMMLQLRQSGLLARAGAIVIGELPRCDEPGGEATARNTMTALLADFPGPVVIGFPSGHTTSPARTLPLGVRVRVVADRRGGRLIVEEGAVQ
jgi:muramoyltetrapeptide carboxypeptidase